MKPLAGVALAALTLGCRPPTGPSRPAATPSPPPPLQGEVAVAQPHAVLFDARGRRFVEIDGADSRVVAATRTGIAGIVAGQRARLYRDGKPALALQGDVQVDSKRQIVRATGGVRAHSLDPHRPATLQADTIEWRYATGILLGTGAVRINYGSGLELSGSSIRADTKLESVDIDFGR